MSNEELLVSARKEPSGEAMVELLQRLSPFICSKANQLGRSEQDRQDYYQEGVIGFLSAVYAYKPDGGASFSTFACTCVLNKMRNHRKALEKDDEYSALSLSESFDIKDDYSCDPERMIQACIKAENILCSIEQKLSEFEKKVLYLRLNGYSYSDISEKTGKSVKSVDNCLQRIRNKLHDEDDD